MHPLQDEDHSGNDPRLVPCLLISCSGLFPERFRNLTGLVDSEEIVDLELSTKNPVFCLLNSWDNFFLNLPSISSDFLVIYSSFTLVMVEFCDWLFLGVPSWLSLANAANSLLFLKVAIFWSENCGTVVKTGLSWLIYTSSYEQNWGKLDNDYKTWLMKNGTVKYILGISTFISPIFPFSLAGNIIANTPIQGTKQGKVL